MHPVVNSSIGFLLGSTNLCHVVPDLTLHERAVETQVFVKA